MKKLLFALVFLTATSSQAFAADPVLNVGALEVLTFPDSEHIGAYGYVGGSLIVPMSDDFLLVPGLSVEFSPDVAGDAHWGFVGTLIGSYVLGEVSTLDGIGTILHDQVGGDFGGAAVFAGLGLGYTNLFGSVSISPSLNVYQDLVTGSGMSFAPLLNVGYAL